MRYALLLTVALLSLATVLPAQPGSIGIFSTPDASDCNFFDLTAAAEYEAVGLVEFYIVHVYAGGVTGSRFSAPQPPCLNCTYMYEELISETPENNKISVGTALDGISIGYGQCLSGNIHIMTIAYYCWGGTPPDCYYRILPDPGEDTGNVVVTDCDFNILPSTGGVGIINPTVASRSIMETCNIPVEENSWGMIKAIYHSSR
jgi:hypothetical protein